MNHARFEVVREKLARCTLLTQFRKHTSLNRWVHCRIKKFKYLCRDQMEKIWDFNPEGLKFEFHMWPVIRAFSKKKWWVCLPSLDK